MADQISHLPLQFLGLSNVPGVPYLLTLSEPLGTVLRLGLRSSKTQTAKKALSNTYTIAGRTATGFEFLYGSAPSDPLRGAVREIERIVLGGEDALVASMKSSSTVAPELTRAASQNPTKPLENP